MVGVPESVEPVGALLGDHDPRAGGTRGNHYRTGPAVAFCPDRDVHRPVRGFHVPAGQQCVQVGDRCRRHRVGRGWGRCCISSSTGSWNAWETHGAAVYSPSCLWSGRRHPNLVPDVAHGAHVLRQPLWRRWPSVRGVEELRGDLPANAKQSHVGGIPQQYHVDRIWRHRSCHLGVAGRGAWPIAVASRRSPRPWSSCRWRSRWLAARSSGT